MLVKFKYFIVLIFKLILIKADDSVIIWDSSTSPQTPALGKTSSEDFKNYIISDSRDSMIIAFINDENTYTKDLFTCKTNSGEKCFSELSKKKNLIFYRNVEDAIGALKDTSLKIEYPDINENGELKTPLTHEIKKVVIIPLNTNNEVNKADALHKLDKIIHKISESVSPNEKTVKMFIKSNQIKTRITRQAQQQPQKQVAKSGFAYNAENKFLVYFKELSFKAKTNHKEKSNTVTVTVTEVKVNNETENGFNIEVIGNSDKNAHKLKFRIDKISGYWYANNFEFDDKKLISEIPINAAEKFSFYCGNQKFINKEIEVHLDHLQMEPNFNKTNGGQSINFDDPWHCVGFTSIGIWSGLFVTFMMLAILSIGITWLMDIRTMDRFDDPKGKTITINASE